METPRTSSSLTVEPGGRIYAVGGWSPPGNPGRAARQARQLETEQRKAQAAARRAELEALRAELRQQPYLPARGATGPHAGRSYRRFRLPAHRATSETLAGAYPFLAEEGLGSAGILIGQDAWSGTAFCYDPWVLYQQGVLTNPNIVLAGQIGRGKSALAKSLACRCIAYGRRVYVPGDPKGEWTNVAQAVGGQALELSVGGPNRLNPLDEGPRPSDLNDSTWKRKVMFRRMELLGALTAATLGRSVGPTERSALDAALTDALSRSDIPVLPAVVDALLDPRHSRRRRRSGRGIPAIGAGRERRGRAGAVDNLTDCDHGRGGARPGAITDSHLSPPLPPASM